MLDKPFVIEHPDFAGFHERNPDFDIVTADLTDTTAIATLELGDRDPSVLLKPLRTYQRLARLGVDGTVAEQLKDRGCDSALAIAGVTEDLFAQRHCDALSCSEAELRTVHARARVARSRVHHLWANLRDTMSPHLRSMRFFTTGDAFEALVSDIPDYQTLFGSVDFCDCQHCRSIFGPAAYLTDLLRVTETYITAPNKGIPAGFKLRDRRGDLFDDLYLTCENTNTLVSFLSIANTVLAGVLPSPVGEASEAWRQRRKDGGPFFQSDYVAATAVLAYNLPLNLPLATVRVSLQRMNTSLGHVYGVLTPPPGQTNDKLPVSSDVERERLGLSVEQLRIVATPTPDDAALALYYGQPKIVLPGPLTGSFSAAAKSKTVTASSDAFKSELSVGGVFQAAGLSRVVTEISTTANSFTVDSEYAEGFSDVTTAETIPPDSIAVMATFSDATGIVFDGLTALFDQNMDEDEGKANIASFFFINGGQGDAAWLDVVTDQTDPQALIQYVAPTQWSDGKRSLGRLDAAALDRVNRFDRLARWLGWSYADLDIVLRVAANPPSLSGSTTYPILAGTATLAARFKIKLDETAALWGDMNTYGRGPGPAPADLFDRVFNNPSFSQGKAAYRPTYAANPLFTTEVDDWSISGSDTDATTTRAWLIGSLGMTDNDLTEAATFVAGGADTLSLTVPALSALYRLKLLASGLKVSIPALFSLFALGGIKTAAPTAKEIMDLVTLKDWIDSTDFSLGDVSYLTSGTPPQGYRPLISADRVLPFLTALWGASEAWLITSAMLQSDTENPDQAQKVFAALVANNLLTDIGAVPLERSEFHALAATYKVTVADLESAGLIDAGEAGEAFTRLQSNGIIDDKGVLWQPVDANTDLVFLFPGSDQQPSQIEWVRSVLVARTLAIGFRWTAPALPLTADNLVVGTITEPEAQTAFAALQTNNVLAKDGSLVAPFDQTADLSYLFDGDRAKIELARSVLLQRSGTVLHTGEVLLDGFNSQHFGTYKSLSDLFDSSSAMTDVLAAEAAEAAGLSQLVPNLLTPVPAGKPVESKVLDFFLLMGRLVLVTDRLDLQPWDVKGAIDYPAVFNFTDLNTLDLKVLQGLARYASLARTYGQTAGQLITALAFPDQSFKAIATLTGWNQGQTASLAKAFWPPDGVGWSTVDGLQRLHLVFAQTRNIGVDISSMLMLGALARLPSLPLPTLDRPAPLPSEWTQYVDMASKLFNTLGARYDDSRWPEVSDEVNATLDEMRRDAYVPIAIQSLSSKYPEINTKRALSEYLLLDVETMGCDKTSKVAEGIAALQTYMQRSRLRLEPGVTKIAFPEIWWEWLAAYRVWEANRKIFVYPENYLEPELRRNSTPLFQQFQNTLNENEVNEENVYNAYVDFMNGFSDEARLRVVDSMYAEAPDPLTGAPTKTLFVIGRTVSDTTPDYYIRRLLNFVSWTAWQKVDVKIPASTVTPVFALGRLFLFWVETERVQLNSIGGNTNSVTQTNAFSWKARIKYTFERFGGVWAAPQVLVENDVFSFAGYDVSYAPWGIDYQTIQTAARYWHQPYLLGVPAEDPTQERLVVMLGRSWQNPRAITVKPPPETPFSELDELLADAQRAAEFGSKAIEPFGFVGAVPLLKGFSLDSSLSTTSGSVIMRTNQGQGTIDPVYGAAYETGDGETRLGMFLATNTFIANSLADSQLLTITDPDLNPWYKAGPVVNLYNLAPDVAFVKSVKNQLGWFIFNNGDESFLGCAQVPDMKTVSEITTLNPFTITGPNDIVLFSDDPYTATPDLSTLKVQYYRMSTGAIDRVGRILWGGGVAAMLDIAVQQDPGPAGLSFTRFYKANGGDGGTDDKCDPKGGGQTPPANVIPPAVLCGGQIDFGGRGKISAYGIYWRELYFHIPFLIAHHLNVHQKFEDAKKWYEYIFNPTDEEVTVPPEDRVWRYLPFRGQTPPSLLDILSDEDAIKVWNDHPFDAHSIANMRITAYQKTIVMHYIDNLLDWADSLFARDTRESITEAALLYFLAADLLGPRPRSVGPCSQQPPMTFGDILERYGDAADIPEFLINLEQKLPALPAPAVTVSDYALPMNDINAYYCVPDNPDLVAYWDRVEDRLFKIRHCMNIEGVVRALALFEPPLDPRLLVAGAAAGASLRDIIQGAETAIPHYRFASMLERAKSLTATLTSFGQSLLQALEKKDAEALAVLQNTQQKQILGLTTKIKEQAVEEADETIGSLQEQLASATYRQTFYQGLIDSGLSPAEISTIVNMVIANVFALAGGAFHTAAGAAHLIPNVGSPFAMTYGGLQVGSSLNAFGTFFDTISGQFSFASTLSSTVGSFERRAQDWELQAELAGYEVTQLGKQIAGAQIRKAMAERDLEINQQQIAQSEEMATFLADKFTNIELYQWMSGQLSAAYFQTYQTAYEMALAAQKASQFELDTDETFVNYGYWNSLRKGLTAGEQLTLSLAQMEESYLRRNARRLVIEKTISLMQINPRALLDLQTTGSCTFELNARMFDGSFPGHYARKIERLSVTVPAITGPYENINGSLTQTGNFITLSNDPDTELFLLGKAGVEPPDHSKLRVNWKANQQIAISTGVDDTGLPRTAGGGVDDRYAPFEGTGAISQWRLELPKATNRVDIGTIPDVVIQLTYTALPGGATLSAPVIEELESQGYSGARIAFLANTYANAWDAFMNPPDGATEQTMTYVTGRSLFPGNLSGISLTELVFGLTIAPGIDFKGPLVATVNIPGLTDAKTVTFTAETSQPVPIDPALEDFMTGDWTLTVAKTAVPKELRNAEGYIDPNKLLNIGQVMVFDATVPWKQS